MGTINYKEKGLEREEVLCALYNHSKPLGLGALHFVAGDMSVNEAKELLEQVDYVDYLHGRVIKTKFARFSETIDPYLYDRNNGEGAALRAIDEYAAKKAGK